jgi:hypothetical protein
VSEPTATGDIKNLDKMTSAQIEAHYAEIEQFLREGKTYSWIQRHYGLHRQTMRRRIAQVKGRIESHDRAISPPPERPRPMVASRAVNILLEPISTKPLQGGRLTKMIGAPRVGQQVNPPEAGEWRLENLSADELRRMSPADLIARMVRISPEMSRAYYDYLRMANPGWELKALTPGTETPNPAGQEYLDACMLQLSRRHGAVDVVWNRLLTNGYIRGALFLELVLARDARTFADLVIPDAYSARFKLVDDPDIGGQKYQLVQGTGRDEVVLDRPTIKYIPIDPLPDTPYGTSPVAPGLFPALFLITMLLDARRVVAQQGWPRLDIMIDIEQLIAAMPIEDQQDPAKVKAMVDEAVNQVAASYSDLAPDQAWVHSSTITFGTPVGAIGSLDGVDALVSVLERMAIRALKSMPLLFGMPEGVSEANANRQWEVHVQGIKAIQGLAEEALSSVLTLGLEAQGIAAVARFRFKELRAAEELRDAQTLFQKIENAEASELLGYITHDEGAIYTWGHPAPEETSIGAVGNDPPPEDTTDDPQGKGGVIDGDTEDEDDIQGDDGVNRISDADFARFLQSMENPNIALGVAYAMARISGRLPEPKRLRGTVDANGTVSIPADYRHTRESAILDTTEANGRGDDGAVLRTMGSDDGPDLQPAMPEVSHQGGV